MALKFSATGIESPLFSPPALSSASMTPLDDGSSEPSSTPPPTLLVSSPSSAASPLYPHPLAATGTVYLSGHGSVAYPTDPTAPTTMNVAPSSPYLAPAQSTGANMQPIGGSATPHGMIAYQQPFDTQPSAQALAAMQYQHQHQQLLLLQQQEQQQQQQQQLQQQLQQQQLQQQHLVPPAEHGPRSMSAPAQDQPPELIPPLGTTTARRTSLPHIIGFQHELACSPFSSPSASPSPSPCSSPVLSPRAGMLLAKPLVGTSGPSSAISKRRSNSLKSGTHASGISTGGGGGGSGNSCSGATTPVKYRWHVYEGGKRRASYSGASSGILRSRETSPHRSRSPTVSTRVGEALGEALRATMSASVADATPHVGTATYAHAGGSDALHASSMANAYFASELEGGASVPLSALIDTGISKLSLSDSGESCESGDSSSSKTSDSETSTTTVDVSGVLTMRQQDAAAALHVSQSKLSKQWKHATGGRDWPWRQVRTQTLIPCTHARACVFCALPFQSPPACYAFVRSGVRCVWHSMRCCQLISRAQDAHCKGIVE